jgi:CDGSH-type Zn-finger protein/truncated hemoglobin YjbI
MSDTEQTAGRPTQTAGRGRLAQVLQTRGGTAAPEAPFVIEHREALIYMLCEAAELEHGIMCQYLFAAFSLKQETSEGLSEAELAAVTNWRKLISRVATQEMLHLALVQNLLSAVGAAPHLVRPNLPQPAVHYPAGVRLALLPFGEAALRHFMFLERPEGMDLQDAEGLAAMGKAAPLMETGDIVPRGQDFATVGHLYRSIEHGIARLADKYGERWLFVGPPRAQATEALFGWPELIAVTDRASAQRAIDTILEQGEGPRGHWRNAHFGRFVEIFDEYQQMKEANPAFDPVRPVVAANVRPAERDPDIALITDPVTARCTDLFNVAYEILLQIFERYFTHTDETDAQLATLASATIRLMAGVLKPLGDLITTLPAGPEYEGKTAGPSFELFYESDYLLPHKEAAWALLAERLDVAASFCETIRAESGGNLAERGVPGSASHGGPGVSPDGAERPPGLAERLAPTAAVLSEIAQAVAAHFPSWAAHGRPTPAPAAPTHAELGSLMTRVRDLAATADGERGDGDARDDEVARGLAEVFDAAYKAVTECASRSGSVSTPLASAAVRLVDSALRPLADALARHRRGGSAGSAASACPVPPPGKAEEHVWRAAECATRWRVRLADLVSTTAPELAEATAALQDLACRLAPAGQEAARLAAFAEIQRGLPATVQVSKNGPYLVTNVPRLISHLGEPMPATPQVALCRCGGSSMKPFCDGTHARTGFDDAKDPKRVPDRRDTYVGEQVTVLDNRGICQHSGFCTDRLPVVFRTGKEPFVAPSGGRMDEIIRAVRDCPSGALSFAFGGSEARGQVDHGGVREPTIEVSKDGPYRITGGITLTNAGPPTAAALDRAEGASLEHYALCRCGHSQNKPFCSGMHWYIEFSDPLPSPAHEPTLFEWAGGLPALTRMTRLLYEKHVPADPLLAPLFADMPPGHPEREAKWLAEVFGGPALYSEERGGHSAMAGAHAGLALTEEQRARWAALTMRAAREAGLPADPEFQAAFSSYIEWGSRAAVSQSQPAAPPQPGGSRAVGGPGVSPGGHGAPPGPAQDAPMPRWDWGPAGPPGAGSPAAAADEAEQPVTLPGPGEAVSFTAHIKPLFREHDRQSMLFAFDLWSGDDVRAHATGILERLRNGSMPCDGAWSEDKIEVFARWAESGMQP